MRLHFISAFVALLLVASTVADVKLPMEGSGEEVPEVAVPIEAAIPINGAAVVPVQSQAREAEPVSYDVDNADVHTKDDEDNVKQRHMVDEEPALRLKHEELKKQQKAKTTSTDATAESASTEATAAESTSTEALTTTTESSSTSTSTQSTTQRIKKIKAARKTTLNFEKMTTTAAPALADPHQKADVSANFDKLLHGESNSAASLGYLFGMAFALAQIVM